MRFNATAKLYPVEARQDERGNIAHVEGEPKEVFANVYEIGLNSYIAAQAAGLHVDAELQLRSADYDGEGIVEFDGDEYTVTRVSSAGEFTRLVLSKRLANKRGGDSE